VWHKGKATLVGGTSASAPAVAAIVALLNDARLKARKGPLGFINPLLYTHGHLFNDVTVGNNAGCGTPGFNVCCLPHGLYLILKYVPIPGNRRVGSRYVRNQSRNQL